MRRRVRPSSLQIAELCKRAPWLALRFSESNAATEDGDTSDAYVSIALMGGAEPPPEAIEAIRLLAWVRATFPKEATFYVQHRVQLVDPRTGEVLAEGTPDLLVVYQVTIAVKVNEHGEEVRPARQITRVVVVDWKTIGQLYAGYLTPPDLALQQLSYMVAAGLEFGADEGQIMLVCFDEDRVKPLEGKIHEADAWWPILDRIAAVPQVDPEGPEPTATKGTHCKTCWQRGHCSAYLLPAFEAGQIPDALVPFSGEGQVLTADDARAALAWLAEADEVLGRAKSLRNLVEGNLQAHVATRGPIRDGARQWGPLPTNGKRSPPTVKELEKMGLTNLIKPPEPGVKYDWRDAPAELTEAAPEAGPALVLVPPPAAKPATGRRRKPRQVELDGRVVELDDQGNPK